MPLSCPECSKSIPAEDINIQAALAKCSACAAVFPLERGAPASQSTALATRVERPEGVVVARGPSTLELTRRWYNPSAWFLAFFAAAWDSFLIFWYTTAVADKAPWIFKVFPIAHVAVGLGVTYLALALFVNRTLFRLDASGLSILHGPLPWKGGKFVRRSDLGALSHRREPSSRRGTALGFSLQVRTPDGRELALASGLEEAQARYLGQELRDFLAPALPQ